MVQVKYIHNTAHLSLCCINVSIIMSMYITTVASTVNFNQLTYSVAEHIGPLTPMVVLSNPLSINFTVQIKDRSKTAIGECIVSINTWSLCIP